MHKVDETFKGDEMEVTEIEMSLQGCSSLNDLEGIHRDRLVNSAKILNFESGEYIFKEFDVANAFYIISKGTVVVEAGSDNNNTVPIQEIDSGEVIGWSWIIPPHYWRFSAKALGDLSLIEFDAEEIRHMCEVDKKFGYEIYKRFSFILAMRLELSRLSLLERNSSSH